MWSIAWIEASHGLRGGGVVPRGRGITDPRNPWLMPRSAAARNPSGATASAPVLHKPVQAAYADVKGSIGRRHERATGELLRGLVREGDTCVDLGAGVGLLSVFMAELAGPAGRVHAFDPDPANEPRLRANAGWCGFADRIELTVAGTVSLDEHFKASHEIDFVRVDTPDAAGALAGMTRTVAKWRPTLLVDCRGDAGAWAAVLRLAKAGYDLVDTRRTPVERDPEAPPAGAVLLIHAKRRDR